MNLTEITDNLNPLAKFEGSIVLRISEILKACQGSKSLMIGIYLIEEDYFLYCNDGLKNLVAKNCKKLFKEGWSFWFSRIDSQEVFRIEEQINHFFTKPFSLQPLSLQYHIMNLEGRRICLKHEILLHQIQRHVLAINYLFDDSDKEHIEHYFDVKWGINSSNPSLDLQCHISAREKEVLNLIANGYSSKEIADKLYISNHTVISHRKNLIEKFQVKNTAHLVTKAAGLIHI